jgi:hypothetical protein
MLAEMASECSSLLRDRSRENNSTLVSSYDVAVLGGLQQRLLQLGQRVRIVTEEARLFA